MDQEKESIFIRCSRYISSCSVATVFLLVGCTTIKKAGLTSLAAGNRCTCGDCIERGCSCTDTGSHDNCICGGCNNRSGSNWSDRKESYE